MSFLLSTGRYSDPQSRVNLGVFDSLKQITTILGSFNLKPLQSLPHKITGENILSTHRLTDGRYLFDALSQGALRYNEISPGFTTNDFFYFRYWAQWGSTIEEARAKGWELVDEQMACLVSTFFEIYVPNESTPEAFFVTESNLPVTGVVKIRIDDSPQNVSEETTSHSLSHTVNSLSAQNSTPKRFSSHKQDSWLLSTDEHIISVREIISQSIQVIEEASRIENSVESKTHQRFSDMMTKLDYQLGHLFVVITGNTSILSQDKIGQELLELGEVVMQKLTEKIESISISRGLLHT